MSAAMHDISHTVGGEDWRRQAAEADKSGQMMAELVKQTEMQQALYEVATAGKRIKNPKPGWRLQERDRKNLQVAIDSAKSTTYVDVHKIVHVESCERMLYCLQEQEWLDAHDQYLPCPMLLLTSDQFCTWVLCCIEELAQVAHSMVQVRLELADARRGGRQERARRSAAPSRGAERPPLAAGVRQPPEG